MKKNPTRKKPRTTAQRAATARLVAANKARRKGGALTAAAVRAAHGGKVTRRKTARRAGTSIVQGGFRILLDGNQVAVFKMKEMALMYARALHNAKPGHTVSVEG